MENIIIRDDQTSIYLKNMYPQNFILLRSVKGVLYADVSYPLETTVITTLLQYH